MWHGNLPWRKLKNLYRSFRRKFFSKNRPREGYVVVDKSVEDIRAILGKEHFAPNWELSYNYRGEVLNLARVEYYYDSAYPQFRWWQVHVRGWEAIGETWLHPHWELEPSEHSAPHIKGVGHDSGSGRAALEEVLDRHDVNYRIDTLDD